MSDPVLITGANGYLGARCVETLARSSERVVAVWHTRRDHVQQSPPANVTYRQCDLTDPSAVEQLLAESRVESIVHAAAVLPDERPGYLARAVRGNIEATAHLADCAARSGCSRFVYCSSISVYGTATCPQGGWTEDTEVRPASTYGWTKHAGEECVRLTAPAHGMTAVSLRLAGIHGPGRSGGAAFNMTLAALRGKPLAAADPGVPFQLLFIDDAIAAVVGALERSLPDAYHRINIASHVFTSLKQLAERIIRACRSTSELVAGAPRAAGTQVMNTTLMSEFLGLEPDDPERRLLELAHWVAAASGLGGSAGS